MFKTLLLVVPALCLAAPAFAQTEAAAAPAPAAKPVKPKKPKKVCRTENLTGSRMPKSFCHTEEEWTSIDSGKVRHDSADVRTLSGDSNH